MSILTFLDTAYDTFQHSQRTIGPAFLTGTKAYDYNHLRYPLDVGAPDKGHYLIIHINTQKQSQFGYTATGENTSYVEDVKRVTSERGAITGGAVFGVGKSLLDDFAQSNQLFNQFYSGVTNISPATISSKFNFGGVIGEQLGQGAGALVDVGKGYLNNLTTNDSVRTTRRITDSIALYMPDTLAFDYQQSYSSLETGKGLAAGLSAAAVSAAEAYKSGQGGAGIVRNVSPFIVQALSNLPGFGSDFARAQIFGALQLVQNPRLELLYTRPNFRSFRFDFNFFPRDEKEALEIQNILQRLRFHQAPEIKSGSGGYFLVPPSEFDIKFYYNGQINPNIDPVSSCVLSDINIDYSPGGPFVAYESLNEQKPSLGRTGMPVNIRLSLGFTETLYKTKDNYKSNFKSPVTPIVNNNVAQAFPVNLNTRTPGGGGVP